MRIAKHLLGRSLLAAVLGFLGQAGYAAEEGLVQQNIYVGTYTGQGSEGIYRLKFTPATGALALDGLAAPMENPSFLALHPSLPVLYAVGEVDGDGDQPGGRVTALSVEKESGALSPINHVSSGGAGPCHVDVAPGGKHLAVANYGGGSVALIAIEKDGALGKQAGFIQHEGKSVNPNRQEGPHAHCVNFDHNGKQLYVADLGLDKVMAYTVASGALAASPKPHYELSPGAGPRHVALSLNGRVMYVVNELDNTVARMKLGADNVAAQVITTLPADFSGTSHTAEIHLHPNGKFLYASNRGHDSIAVFSVNPDTGALTAIGHTPTGGKTPRHFTLSPDGDYLLAANQDSNSVVVFRVDANAGTLTQVGDPVEVPRPVCLLFAR